MVLHEHKLLGLSRSRWPRAVPTYLLVRLALSPYRVASASVLWMGEWLPKTPGLSRVEVVTQACLLMVCRQVRRLARSPKTRGAKVQKPTGPSLGPWLVSGGN